MKAPALPAQSLRGEIMTLQEYVDALRGKRVAVLGIGVSNTPLIDLLLDNGLPITVCDTVSYTHLDVYKRQGQTGFFA